MPIHVTLCTGPTCGALGMRDIRAVVERLAARHPGRIEITDQHCFARCQQAPGLCPSVRIDGEFCVKATEVSVKRHLRELLERGAGAAPPALTPNE